MKLKLREVVRLCGLTTDQLADDSDNRFATMAATRLHRKQATKAGQNLRGTASCGIAL